MMNWQEIVEQANQCHKRTLEEGMVIPLEKIVSNELSCSCCGVTRRIYQVEGHDRECIWYEDEMYRLAQEWFVSQEDDVSWKRRYDMIVGFLLEQVGDLKKCIEEERASR